MTPDREDYLRCIAHTEEILDVERRCDNLDERYRILLSRVTELESRLAENAALAETHGELIGNLLDRDKEAHPEDYGDDKDD